MRCARAASRASTTTEMFSSDDPWAMAMTLIPACASAPKTRAAIPGVPAIPSPTTTSVATPGRSSTPSISRRAISLWNSSTRLARARSAAASGTPKQMECSDDAWVMSETEIPLRWTAAKVGAAGRGRRAPAAPARGRALAVRGGGEESGHHGDGAAREQGPEHLAGRPVGAGEVGRGVAEGPVRLHDFRRVHELHGSRARLPQRRREQSGAEPLSARDEIVGGPRRELAHDHETGCDLLELGERLVDESQQLVAAGAGREQRLHARDVAGPRCRRPGPPELAFTPHRPG